MHSRTPESLAVIATANAIDPTVYYPDGDPLAVVEIPRCEAVSLVELPEALGWVFEVVRRTAERVEVGAVSVRRN